MFCRWRPWNGAELHERVADFYDENGTSMFTWDMFYFTCPLNVPGGIDKFSILGGYDKICNPITGITIKFNVDSV